MSWITVVWSMVASAAFTMAAVHLLVWWSNRTAWPSLWFSGTAIATGFFAGYEVLMMQAKTPQEFGSALRWCHVPAWIAIVTLVGFVRVYLKAGRPWLAWTVCALRTVALGLNFAMEPNVNYRMITSLRQVQFFGESVSVAEGVPNPWMAVGQAGLLLFVIFAFEASVTVWRRGDRRQAVVVGGSIFIFMLIGAAQAVLVFWKIVPTPMTASFFFLAVIIAMGYELSRDTLRAARLATDLGESETRMQLVAATAQLGVWTRDLVCHEFRANASWRALFGFSLDEPVDFDRFLLRVHPDDRGYVEGKLRMAIETMGHHELEYRVQLPDGSVRWIASRGRVDYSPSGRPVFVRGVSADITQRRLAEQDALRNWTELAHVSRSVTLGELSGSLAHELNHPLGAILRNTEAAEIYLRQPNPDLEELRAILADIRNDDLRAAAVISRMRAFLQPQAVKHQPVEMNQLVADVISLVRPDAGIRRVQLELMPVGTLPAVTGDRVQLQQVILNLLINALDAVQDKAPESGRVVVRVQRTGRQIEVTVDDNGQGIAAEALGRLFDPFFTTKTKGLGLGLSISRTIVEAHGGRLQAENNPAGGATFSFSVPVAAG